MNEAMWGIEMTDEEFVEVIDVWMEIQRPWNLQSAIDLLLRHDPNDPVNAKRRISFSKENELKRETRAFTLILNSEHDGVNGIRLFEVAKPTATKKEGKAAVDYTVYKKDFVRWADKEWDDNATHLTEALKRYNKTSVYGKKHKTTEQTEPRRTANEEAMQELRSSLSLGERSNMSFDDFHNNMAVRLKSKKQNIYARTKLRELYNDFRVR